MRKASTVVGLTLVALGSAARAQDSVPAPTAPVVSAPAPVVVVPAPAGLVEAPAPVPTTYPARRLELGLSVLGMGFGKITTFTGDDTTPPDSAEFAYGFALSVNYRLIAGLSLGFTPQAIYNVKPKSALTGTSAPQEAKEYDFMARVAYTQPIVETVGVYAEALPGYSMRSGSKWSTGFVLAVGGGVTMGVTERVFTNFGVGYQLGYQKLKLGANAVHPNGEDYLRITLGGGVRF